VPVPVPAPATAPMPLQATTTTTVATATATPPPGNGAFSSPGVAVAVPLPDSSSPPVATSDVAPSGSATGMPALVSESESASSTSTAASSSRTDVAAAPLAPEPRMEQGHADTPAGVGFWVQIGAYRQRAGALDFQHRLVDELPWLGPLLAVFSDHGLNRLQAGPYNTRDDARSAAARIRTALELVPTIVEKR